MRIFPAFPIRLSDCQGFLAVHCPIVQEIHSAFQIKNPFPEQPHGVFLYITCDLHFPADALFTPIDEKIPLAVKTDRLIFRRSKLGKDV